MRFSRSESSTFPVAVTAGGAPPVARIEASYSVQRPADVSSRRAAFRAAVTAGVFAAVLSSVPIGGSFVFALPLAGFLCVLLYRRHSATGEPTVGVGFRLGAGAGLAGFAMLILLGTIETLGFHTQNELRDVMIQAVRQAQSRYADPQARQSLEYFLTPGGMAFLMIFGFAFMCVLFVILSGIGGAISAAFLRRKLPPH
ncbi:MAG: hypothetical protein DMG98_05745 [Acidobacteria bacterium]|nr:MAG: hypothetical protein DMG98_05745 [Acidobacteriota bacterium]